MPFFNGGLQKLLGSKKEQQKPSVHVSAKMVGSREDIQRHCLKTLICAVRIGDGKQDMQNGKDFYKYFFTNFPQLRVYFKGAENYTADDVQNSQRFEKQGQRLLLAVYLIVLTYTNEMVFASYARETVSRHKQFKLATELWTAFWAVFEGFLLTKTTLSDEEKKAWAKLGADFAAICLEHEKKLAAEKNQSVPAKEMKNMKISDKK